MKTSGYVYDSINNTLTITAAFAKKASQIGTPEYEIMKTLRRDNPGMTVKKQSAAHAGPKTLSVKYADMEHYIGLFPQGKREVLMKMYETMRIASKTHSNPYQWVREWFLDYFPYFNADLTFDECGNVTNLLTKADVEQQKLDEELAAAVNAAKAEAETAIAA